MKLHLLFVFFFYSNCYAENSSDFTIHNFIKHIVMCSNKYEKVYKSYINMK